MKMSLTKVKWTLIFRCNAQKISGVSNWIRFSLIWFIFLLLDGFIYMCWFIYFAELKWLLEFPVWWTTNTCCLNFFLLFRPFRIFSSFSRRRRFYSDNCLFVLQVESKRIKLIEFFSHFNLNFLFPPSSINIWSFSLTFFGEAFLYLE